MVFKNKALKKINKKLKFCLHWVPLGFKKCSLFVSYVHLSYKYVKIYFSSNIQALRGTVYFKEQKLRLIPIMSLFLWKATILLEYCSNLTYFLNRTFTGQGKLLAICPQWYLRTLRSSEKSPIPYLKLSQTSESSKW